jgi:hypothetical protein
METARTVTRRGGYCALGRRQAEPHRILCRMPLIIPMRIQTILLDPSRCVWIDEASNGSGPDSSVAVQSDAEHPARNRKVGYLSASLRLLAAIE